MSDTKELIIKKRDGKSLSIEEIRRLLQGYAERSIPDYQMSAFMMAQEFKGMNPQEQRDWLQVIEGMKDKPNLSEIEITHELINKKRRGERLSKEQLHQLMQDYMNASIADYQMSAWLMCVYFKGMDKQETTDFTLALVNTGKKMDLSAIEGTVVDKHSTGGVGDKTTLILGPLLASLGVPVAKMSGRGLGHTGGTIDKLDAIPSPDGLSHFDTSLELDDFIDLVNQQNIAVAGQTSDLAPGDKKLYALRDVTGTVESLPLIAASVMSKKIASGADAIVLDVKTGSGAFMKTEAEAVELSQTMVDIGEGLGIKTVAVVTDMSQPLGYAVGNATEVREAIEVLRGEGPNDLREATLALGTEMLCLAKESISFEEARIMLEAAIFDRRALDKCREWIASQGGNPDIVDQLDNARNKPELLAQARGQHVVKAQQSGFIGSMDSEKIGLCAGKLGAGRAVKEDQIEPAVGLIMHCKIGDRVEEGDPLYTLYYNESEKLAKVLEMGLDDSDMIPILPDLQSSPQLIKRVIGRGDLLS